MRAREALVDALPVLQVRPGPQEPTKTGWWHRVNVELVGTEEHVPVLHKDPPQRGRPDACSTDTGCRALLSGTTGIEKDILFSAHCANMLRGGYLPPRRAQSRAEETCLPTQRGSGGAAFTTPLPGLQPQPRLEGELPPNSATDDQHLAIQRAGSGWPGPALASPSGCRRSGPLSRPSTRFSARSIGWDTALYGSAWPFPKNETGQPRLADDHDSIHKTVPRSCVGAFLQLRHAALLDSVPRGPAHAPILRGTKPAHQELKEMPRSLPCRRHTHLPCR